PGRLDCRGPHLRVDRPRAWLVAGGRQLPLASGRAGVGQRGSGDGATFQSRAMQRAEEVKIVAPLGQAMKTLGRAS
ncbi:MAG TPA: hypothetical protein VN960_01675, partial [Gaiellaceae bacterium]|nr:hypothetical protein [Gaiellaceae bacterium]